MRSSGRCNPRLEESIGFRHNYDVREQQSHFMGDSGEWVGMSLSDYLGQKAADGNSKKPIRIRMEEGDQLSEIKETSETEHQLQEQNSRLLSSSRNNRQQTPKDKKFIIKKKQPYKKKNNLSLKVLASTQFSSFKSQPKRRSLLPKSLTKFKTIQTFFSQKQVGGEASLGGRQGGPKESKERRKKEKFSAYLSNMRSKLEQRMRQSYLEARHKI